MASGIVLRSVQPRVCGEHKKGGHTLGQMGGSAPRMRGTLDRMFGPRRALRFSPAYAGNTLFRATRRSPGSVQPRVCGEHPLRGRAGVDGHGSAPRMRGTPDPLQHRHPVERFSPAYAGNTRPPPRHRGSTPVQPRVCGEHYETPTEDCSVAGSAPRMRGTHEAGAGPPLDGRFSPAYAGNTPDHRRPDRPRTVQPRVCGEHLGRLGKDWRKVGSAPRMRGTLRADLDRPADDRFSPAYAGNTRSSAPGGSDGAVQPRVCGEHIA